MNDAIHQIHQIEYRWDPTYDLSPALSSMPHGRKMQWDAQIRTWVRHPSVEAPSRSVRYQILPGGGAALAWRYRDIDVTDADGAVRGRPLVTRVLVGAARVLSPGAALALCWSGLPAVAGPRPGEAELPSMLPVISSAELDAVADAAVGGLDQEAARQEDLQPVLAAALGNPDTPLAVAVGEPQVFQPPAESIQLLLLWGLWRIGYPLLGARRRRWSFSTFEAPLGYTDPRSLPDIVFRSARVAQSAPPTVPREELKVFLGAGAAPVSGTIFDELAAWLTAEYRELGGDQLQRLIAEAIDGAPDDSRILIAYDRLSARRASPDEPDLRHEPGIEVPPLDGLPLTEPSPPAPVRDPDEVTARSDEGKPADEEFAPASFSLAELIDQLAVACDADHFAALLGEALAVPPLDEAGRRQARAAFGDNNCLVPVFRRHRYAPDVHALARIVALIVLPDLGQPTVRAEAADWADRGESAVVAALLTGARYAGAEVLRDMKDILRPVLAELWLTDRRLLAYWSPGPARR